MLRFVILFLLWLVLSGQFSPLFLLFGALSSAFVVYWYGALIAPLGLRLMDTPGMLRPDRSLVYLGWLLIEIIKASGYVIYSLLGRTLRIRPAMGWIPYAGLPVLGQALLANSITLTPGTISVDIDERGIYVHALDLDLLHGTENANIPHRVGALLSVNTAGDAA